VDFACASSPASMVGDSDVFTSENIYALIVALESGSIHSVQSALEFNDLRLTPFLECDARLLDREMLSFLARI
jgi:hypothetical protein